MSLTRSLITQQHRPILDQLLVRLSLRQGQVSNRSSPLMETLGGFAIVGGLMYGGYSVVAMGAQPGQFFSFLTAFLLAYEPAKRLGGSISN